MNASWGEGVSWGQLKIFRPSGSISNVQVKIVGQVDLYPRGQLKMVWLSGSWWVETDAKGTGNLLVCYRIAQGWFPCAWDGCLHHIALFLPWPYHLQWGYWAHWLHSVPLPLVQVTFCKISQQGQWMGAASEGFTKGLRKRQKTWQLVSHDHMSKLVRDYKRQFMSNKEHKRVVHCVTHPQQGLA